MLPRRRWGERLRGTLPDRGRMDRDDESEGSAASTHDHQAQHRGQDPLWSQCEPGELVI